MSRMQVTKGRQKAGQRESATRSPLRQGPTSLKKSGALLARLQRLVGNCYVQHWLAPHSTGFELDDETAGRINRARGGGRPLDSALQQQMSAALGYDFTHVRVHTSSESDALNRQLSARAFTTGQDIFLRQGAYNPSSSRGRELIAHELSHVVQQTTGRVRGSGGRMTVRPAGDAFEREADALARQAASAVYVAGARAEEKAQANLGGNVPVGRYEQEADQAAEHTSFCVQRNCNNIANHAQRDLPGVNNCHQAVAHWLAESGIVTSANANQALRQDHFGHPNWPSFAHHIFYDNGHDRTQVRKLVGQNMSLQPGLIVGFYEHVADTLTHSMVSLGGGRVAGHNNLGTFGSLAREQDLNLRPWQAGPADPAGQMSILTTAFGGQLKVFLAHPGAAAQRVTTMVG